MTNLLKETLKVLKEYNKSPSDVLWVGSVDIKITWENFISIASTYDYGGFGIQEVAEDLLIVGDNWWLERHEYDGSEWWEYKSLPQEPLIFRTLQYLGASETNPSRSYGWMTLKELND